MLKAQDLQTLGFSIREDIHPHELFSAPPASDAARAEALRHVLTDYNLDPAGGAPKQSSSRITASEIAHAMLPTFQGKKHEESWLVYLDANGVIGKECLSQGSEHSTTFDTKLAVKNAIENHAQAVVLLHNHPKGMPLPGKADAAVTLSLREALREFGITLADHLIIGQSQYYSVLAGTLFDFKQEQ